MEEWKSDVWKAEWEASQAAAEQILIADSTVILLEGRPVSSTSQQPITTESTTDVMASEIPIATTDEHDREGNGDIQHPPQSTVAFATLSEIVSPGVTSPPSNDPLETTHVIPTVQILPQTIQHHSSVFSEFSSRTDDMAEGVPTADVEFVHSPRSVEIDLSTPVSTDSPSTATLSSVASNTLASVTVFSLSTPSGSGVASDPPPPQIITETVSTTIILSAAMPTSSASAPSGESIYRMIINRLSTLEGNQTLYARYVEEQGRMVNLRLERMEEDIGRLGGIVSVQRAEPEYCVLIPNMIRSRCNSSTSRKCWRPTVRKWNSNTENWFHRWNTWHRRFGWRRDSGQHNYCCLSLFWCS